MQHHKSKIFSTVKFLYPIMAGVSMKIGLLIIGSEVLDGKITDSNTKILAEYLRSLHLEIAESLSCRDSRDAIAKSLDQLHRHCDIVVTSGGLGPTRDDITKETLGDFFDKKLVFNEAALKVAQENYSRFNRTFPGKEHGYCYLPEGFTPLYNSTGFAPAFYFKDKKKLTISGPGVPREFRSILEDHFKSIASDFLEKNVFFDHFTARTKNVPEEKIFSEVDPELWEKLEAFGEVSSLPILMGVDIGIKLRAKSKEELSEKVRAVKEIFEHSPVKKHIWHYGKESIEEKIVFLACQKNIKFGFAESATGGLCSHRITNVKGSSQCFTGSVICYDEKIKEHVLKVKKETIEKFTAVSLECAQEMAKGLAHHFSLDIAISITGYAGPGGGTEKHPVGSVCIGRSGKQVSTSSEEMVLKGDREILKQRFSQAALYALLDEVEKFA